MLILAQDIVKHFHISGHYDIHYVDDNCYSGPNDGENR